MKLATVQSSFKTDLGNKVLEMYNYFSVDNNSQIKTIPTYEHFEKFMQTCNDTVYDNKNTFVTGVPLCNKMKLSNSNSIIVGYSSGFDSTYQALRFLKEGKNVILFHCNNLNKSYPDEKVKAQEFANKFGMEIVTVDFEHGDNSYCIDNPIKNQLILALMIDYGVQNGINNFAMGNNIFEKISECRVQYGISDSIENFEYFRNAIKHYIKNINFYDIEIKKNECYKFVAENYFDAFEYVNSCISPHRFKKHLNKVNTEKYGIVPLSDNRCMSCYKCAIEYITLSKFGFLPMNQEYRKHCFDIIRKKSDTIFTTKIASKKSTNEEIERNIFDE